MTEEKDGKVISLAERRKEKNNQPDKDLSPEKGGDSSSVGSGESDLAGFPGKMVWLYCPTCKSLEYTESVIPGGRTHNVCGNMVEEKQEEVDLRAEYTIAQINLDRLNILEELVGGQRKRYEEYKKRLTLAAGKKLPPYPLDENTLKNLPVAELDALGLMVSRFFSNPAKHFGLDDNKPDANPESPEPPKPKG